ncbi:hypothetical protein K504DRAFT_87742 [Pleomassaria siparia CBS 279.74]|uniref:Uncharacterized protein n=1 Tax=Pleomassaria siparia CBS 279.74 TaxID=1314801 RepID=A0A6G1K054_9PLEO|nr:hypothetical protein K504DRAFT_87742 [Pleomassaria siparia CBS 279.74]
MRLDACHGPAARFAGAIWGLAGVASYIDSPIEPNDPARLTTTVHVHCTQCVHTQTVIRTYRAYKGAESALPTLYPTRPTRHGLTLTNMTGQCSVRRVQCAVCSVQCAVCSVQTTAKVMAHKGKDRNGNCSNQLTAFNPTLPSNLQQRRRAFSLATCHQATLVHTYILCTYVHSRPSSHQAIKPSSHQAIKPSSHQAIKTTKPPNIEQSPNS